MGTEMSSKQIAVETAAVGKGSPPPGGHVHKSIAHGAALAAGEGTEGLESVPHGTSSGSTKEEKER